jgi:hypothetical protein
MRNLTLTIQFCDISQSFVSAIKYENIYTFLYLVYFTLRSHFTGPLRIRDNIEIK